MYSQWWQSSVFAKKNSLSPRYKTVEKIRTGMPVVVLPADLIKDAM